MPPMKRPHTEQFPEVGDTVSLASLAKRWKTSQPAVRGLMGKQLLGFVQVRDRFRIPRTEVERIEDLIARKEIVLPRSARVVRRRSTKPAIDSQ